MLGKTSSGRGLLCMKGKLSDTRSAWSHHFPETGTIGFIHMIHSKDTETSEARQHLNLIDYGLAVPSDLHSNPQEKVANKNGGVFLWITSAKI